MRKTVIALVALGLVVASSAFAAHAVRISQVYGGGGGGGGAYKYDYVELFNSSGYNVDIGGWSVQYAAANGNVFGSGTYNVCVFPAGTTIRACGYLLIRSGNAGASGADLPLEDAVMGAYMGTTAGNVALFADAVMGRDCAAAQAVAIDLVGYGTEPTAGVDFAVIGGDTGENASADAADFATFGIAAICSEGAGPVADLSATTCAVRNNDGMIDTDNNNLDFTVASSWTIHNSASPTNPGCTVVPAMSDTWGLIKTLYR